MVLQRLNPIQAFPRVLRKRICMTMTGEHVTNGDDTLTMRIIYLFRYSISGENTYLCLDLYTGIVYECIPMCAYYGEKCKHIQ